MRSDNNQTDIFRDDPALIARQWREAAETSAKQFPDDVRRKDYYMAEAQRWERIACGREVADVV